MSLRVVIADDEPLVRKSVRRFLRGHDVEVIAECVDGTSAVHAIRSKMPDVVFLDMQMPEMGGLEVIETIGEDKMPATIILTAYDKYAVKAFEYRVADYVLKPFGKDRFDKALSRAQHWATLRAQAMSGGVNAQIAELLEQLRRSKEYPDRIALPRYGRIILMETRHIQWIEAAGNTLHIHADQQVYNLRETLATMQGRLDPRQFVRIHRSTLVNVRFIREIRPWFNGYHVVVLLNNQELRMSRYQRESIQRLMNSSL